MVAETESEVTTTEPSVEDAPVEDAPTEDAPVVEETPEEEPEPDPLAELRVQLENAATKDELNAVRSNVGRIDSIQSTLDALAKRDPLAEVDPRIDANEQLTTALAQALIGLDDDVVPGLNKEALRTATAAVEAARGERALTAKVEKLLAERQQPDPEPQPVAQSSDADKATASVVGYAEAKGVDPTTLTWTREPGETLEVASKRLKAVVDSLVNGEEATERIAERRAAAGSGSPARSGNANTTESILTKLSENGVAALTEKERDIAAKELGVQL